MRVYHYHGGQSKHHVVRGMVRGAPRGWGPTGAACRAGRAAPLLHPHPLATKAKRGHRASARQVHKLGQGFAVALVVVVVVIGCCCACIPRCTGGKVLASFEGAAREAAQLVLVQGQPQFEPAAGKLKRRHVYLLKEGGKQAGSRKQANNTTRARSSTLDVWLLWATAGDRPHLHRELLD